MAKEIHRIIIAMRLEPDEHIEEAKPWDMLVERVKAVVEEAKNDPQFAALRWAFSNVEVEPYDEPYREVFARWGWDGYDQPSEQEQQ